MKRIRRITVNMISITTVATTTGRLGSIVSTASSPQTTSNVTQQRPNRSQWALGV
jgi:hypothetical protein